MTPDELSRLATPPRPVPLSVYLRVLLGGLLPQIGWLLFGFGMIFVWPFGGNAVVVSLVHFSGPVDYVEGRMTRIQETNVTINDERVYAFHYAYVVGGEQLDGVSRGMRGSTSMSDPVTIEYAVGNPARSRIEGFGEPMTALYFVWILPGAGLLLVLFGLRKGFRGARLLGRGVVSQGRLVSRQPTNTTVNDQTVWKFTFEFEGAHGRRGIVTARTHVTSRFGGTEDDPESVVEAVLHDPHDPDRAVLVDDLPGSLHVASDGNLEGSMGAAVAVFLLPGITLLSHGGWLLFVLR